MKQLLRSLDRDGVLIQADALHTAQSYFDGASPKGADVPLAVKSNQKTLYRQIGCQFKRRW